MTRMLPRRRLHDWFAAEPDGRLTITAWLCRFTLLCSIMALAVFAVGRLDKLTRIDTAAAISQTHIN